MTMHFFEVEEAVKHGIESAILLSNIRFWLTKNKANQSHIHDGYYWTYNSAAAFVELFPYMTKQSIARYLKNLCDAGVLKSGNYNEIKYDRKLWYTIPAEFAVKQPEALNLAISQNETCTSQNEASITQNEKSISYFETSISQNGAPIADINTDINPDVIADTDKTESTRDDQKAATVAGESPSTVAGESPSTVAGESPSGELGKAQLPSLAKSIYPARESQAGVTEITSETTATDSSLSNEELNCFEWAKKEPYWSKLVYSEKAFLKHYRSESQALKGQYQNWLEMQKEEAQKNAPKKPVPVKPVWQKMGFSSEQDYNAAHLRKLKQMEVEMRGVH